MNLKDLWKRIKPSFKIALVIWTLIVILLYVLKQVVVLSEVLLLWLIGSLILTLLVQFTFKQSTSDEISEEENTTDNMEVQTDNQVENTTELSLPIIENSNKSSSPKTDLYTMYKKFKENRQDNKPENIEQFAVMCNGLLEHQDEMKFYKDYDVSSPDAQTIYFKDGKMYKVFPSDQESWYDARYLVSDGITYDLEKIDDIKAIPIPEFNKFDTMMEGYGVTGSLDYVIRMKAGAFYNRKEKELCSACLWKSTELMFANKAIAWQKKDFDRLISWHLELGMYDEAGKAKEYLSRCEQYTENGFDITAKSIRDSTFKHMKELDMDLVVYQDYGTGCCSECAKMRGRVYSISGLNKKFPKLPEYAKINGNFHPGCRCSMSPYFEGETIFYKGNRVNALKASNRPWIDDRDEKEIKLYEDYLQLIKNEQDKENDREEYYSIIKTLPNLAPKSFGAYRRMKNSKTANFMKLVDAAKAAGIEIKV